MKTNTTTKQTSSSSSTILNAAKRITLGKAVDPTLSPERIHELVELHDEAARKGDDAERWKWRNALCDKRRAGATWDVVDEDGDVYEGMPDGIVVALLQDIRAELQGIRQALERRR